MEIWGVEGNWRERDTAISQSIFENVVRSLQQHPKLLYGETGAYSIELFVPGRIINFWTRIVIVNQSKLSAIMYKLICTLHVDQNGDYNSKWINCVKRTLNHAGFSNVWLSKILEP